MSTRGKAVERGSSVGRFGESRRLEQRPRPDIRHREVHLLATVVDGISLDRRCAQPLRVRDGPLDQRVRYALPAVPRTHPHAPERPHVEVVDVRDEPVPRERGIPAGMNRRPPDRFVVEVSDHAGRRVLMAELPRAIRALGASQLIVLFAADPIAQAEAHVRRRLLRPHEKGHVVELGRRSHLDAHAESLMHPTDIVEHLDRFPTGMDDSERAIRRAGSPTHARNPQGKPTRTAPTPPWRGARTRACARAATAG